jgi:DNA-nicking Smr family endonuclease
MKAGDVSDRREKRPRSRQEEGGDLQTMMNSWLDTHEIPDKDALVEEEASRQGDRQRLRTKRPDARIDLHGMTRDAAWEALDGFFQESCLGGCEKLIIIHGKGNHAGSDGALKRLCRQFIEQNPLAGEHWQGRAAEGGTGVTLVLLKGAKR